ncbi:MAG: hypothetical protein J6V90_04900 [Treponema sp.]|nr:hypothetical protein [Treponema sp.]
MQASVALPLTNKPIEFHGSKLFDGAMIDNIPVKPFLDLDLIICLYFEDGGIVFENDDFDSKIIKIVFKNSSIIRDSVCFEQKKINDMLAEGYSFTKKTLAFYFSEGKDNIQYAKEKIRMTNEENKDRKPRKTGDFVVREFNKLMKHFVKQL